MLGYLRGKILNSVGEGEGKLTIGVGSDEFGIVGYAVNVPRRSHYELLPHGKQIEFFIYTHVREDSLDLYGFGTRAEKELFLTLLSVNGIGPKGALNVLSGSDSGQLIQAIVDGDKQFLTKVPGIGKKTAERVVLELSDPLKKKLDAGGFAELGLGTVVVGGVVVTGTKSISRPVIQGSNAVLRDAKDALVGLGYRENDVSSLLSKVFAEFETPPKAEDLIKTALRQLA